MTTMIPRVISSNATRTEAFIFSEIQRAQNTTDYTCFQSVGLTRHERKEFAEADFIIISPRSLMCLEVKGGTVARQNGGWRIGSGERSYASKEGPFKQAEGARWAIGRYLKECVGRDPRKDLLIGWGVVLPDIVFDERDPSWDQALVYDQRDREQPFDNYLRRLECYFAKRREETGRSALKPLQPGVLQQYIDALRGDFEADTSLRGLIAEGKRELRDLSSEQTRVLDFALNEHNPRLLCEGGPGTGKTYVAIDAARRLAADGAEVLFLCFNRALATTLARDERAVSSRFRIASLHQFLDDAIRRAGLGEELASVRRECAGNRLFKEVYPDLFQEACTRLLTEGEPLLFDALVIDEAQDILSQSYIDCLDLVLDEGLARGRWAIFLDREGQGGMYGSDDAEVMDKLRSFKPVSSHLSENFRNPRAIAAEAYRLVGADEPKCRRMLPVHVDYRTAREDAHSAKTLKALLVDLIRDGIKPGEIAVLSARKPEDSLVIRSKLEIGKPLTPAEVHGNDPNAVTVSSVSAFKGLESEIVILTDLPNPTDNTWDRSVLLVGMTRARTKVFAIVDNLFLKTTSEARL